MKFPQFFPPPFPYNKLKLSTLSFFYTLVLPHRIHIWYLRSVKTLFCKHKDTFKTAYWSDYKIKCSKCFKEIK